MGFDSLEEEQRRCLREALQHARIDTADLWLHYFSIGGNVGEYEVDAHLQGAFPLPELQRDLLAHAANELIDELPPPPRAPYYQDLRSSRSTENHRHTPNA
ncbi:MULTISPECIES: hypothetical protein [unclassified Arthrobacter]|uniref:hypothetical protein n=1 Tax=unclassified Arthrobacter TaxID=235627 RepID=UPI001F34FBB8|nr:hypothetical protein [Arthrobacter sp. FW305-BF8]UKA56185.1 hypothetical protein LFT45_09905 [Arthrobacter sp. FW305-BF8]